MRQPPRAGCCSWLLALRAQAARSGYATKAPQPFNSHITLLRDASHMRYPAAGLLLVISGHVVALLYALRAGQGCTMLSCSDGRIM